ncbi:right-handed parallel beta-helix repeat-containing protein [Oerskovia enterophila]|uniref:Right handed beta helix domain-containing protein n=1 Tax=Oerskovia enterophila TaxID=43678 RepID=A0ABX2Y145_9CELL|nr:right-handed parallel beta-helix repeat-containing protein [Oerskovia enterophila]OCI30272.1 hypothetical protein OERS_30100 [Oerskovia enterophila]
MDPTRPLPRNPITAVLALGLIAVMLFFPDPATVVAEASPEQDAGQETTEAPAPQVVVPDDVTQLAPDPPVTVVPAPTPEPVPATSTATGTTGGSVSGTSSAPRSTGVASESPAGPGPTVTVFMAPGAADSGDGLSPGTAVGSFARAQQVAKSAGGAGANIDVRIAAGTYRLTPSTWSLASPGHRIRFLPQDYVEGQALPVAQVPVFDGSGLGGTYWLDILAPGAETTYDVRSLTVTGYSNGLRISGGYSYKGGPAERASGEGRPLPRPTVTGMTFERIGSAHSAKTGYAAIHVQNTDGARVVANTLHRIENSGAQAGLVHGIYAVLSTGLDVRGNTISKVSGDAVRTRNASSGSVTGNTIEASGVHAAVSDWFCDQACAAKNVQSFECPSGPVDVANNVGTRYAGGQLKAYEVTVSPSGASSGC